MATTTISSGVTSSGLTVSSGDTLDVRSDGTALSATVAGGGVEVILTGGLASSGTVESGGQLVALGRNPDAYVWGEVNDVTIESGGLLDLAGASAEEDVVKSGGTLELGHVLSSNLVVGPQAQASDWIDVHVAAGGILDLNSAYVPDGFQLEIEAGGEASFVTVEHGGVVSGSGEITGVSDIDGALDGVDVAGAATILALGSGAVASGVSISGACAIRIASLHGEVASGVSTAPSELRARAGARSISASVDSGGELLVYEGGVASATTVASGGLVDLKDGVARGATIQDGGRLVVSVGGVASAAAVLDGGLAIIESGGVASGAVVSLGGREVVRSGGVASATTVSSGGIGLDRGSSLGATILAGAEEVVSNGGYASGLTISGGGVLVVESGGSAVDVDVLAGARVIVRGGGYFSSSATPANFESAISNDDTAALAITRTSTAGAAGIFAQSIAGLGGGGTLTGSGAPRHGVSSATAEMLKPH